MRRAGVQPPSFGRSSIGNRANTEVSPMLAAYGSSGGDYSWLIWVVVGLAVLLAIAVFAWWRAHRRTMSSRMNRAKGKINRAVGKTQGRFG
jgi:hypothetical protein